MVVRQELQQLSSQKEAETKRLLEIRQKELEALESSYRPKIDSLSKEENELGERSRKLAQQVLQAEGTLSELETLVRSNTSYLGTQQTEINTRKETVVELTTHEAVLTRSLEALADSITRAKEEKVTTKADIAFLDGEYKEISAKVAVIEQEYTDKKIAKEAELAIMDSKLLDVKQSIQKSSQEAEIERKDLAHRKMMLDERESVLLVRERKVTMDEAKIQNNASLLNL